MRNNQTKNRVGAIILAGGKSSRFGSDKTVVRFRNAPLIQRAINIVKYFTNDILIVSNSQKKFSSLPYPEVSDIIANCGPLGGIYTGLFYSQHEKNIVLPADMPFISKACIDFLLAHSENEDVVVPIHRNHFEPLCAVYSKSCIPAIKNQLLRGNNQVFAFYDEVKTKKLNFDEALNFYHENLFYNINSMKDMQYLEFLSLVFNE